MAKFMSTPNILWRIENFASVHKKMSPTIRFLGMKFHIIFYQYIDSGAIKVQLILVCQNASETSSSCKFDINSCIVLHNGGRYLQKSGKYDLMQNECCVWSDFISTIRNHLDAPDITFLITVVPCGDPGRIISTNKFTEEDFHMSPCALSLSEDIGCLLNDGECSDFTLKCDDRSFNVHKAVLTARSHYFAGMFRSGMMEANENGSIIKKIEPDILEIVLRYMYTGKLPHLPMDSLQKVYSAADRFIVEPLKIKCHSLFIDNITSESEENSEKGREDEQFGFDEQPETTATIENGTKKRQMLRDLFMSREWRLFNEKFPHEAHEMCKPFLFPSL